MNVAQYRKGRGGVKPATACLGVFHERQVLRVDASPPSGVTPHGVREKTLAERRHRPSSGSKPALAAADPDELTAPSLPGAEQGEPPRSGLKGRVARLFAVLFTA